MSWHLGGLEKTEQAMENLVETLNMRIVACSVAALSNTRDSAAQQKLPDGSAYWSPAYDDVCRAVEREMTYRETLQEIYNRMTRWLSDPNTPSTADILTILTMIESNECGERIDAPKSHAVHAPAPSGNTERSE